MSLGSTIWPATAAAATVYGEPKYTNASFEPMRPWKLRLVEEMHTSPSAIIPAPKPAHAPQPDGSKIPPASVIVANVPSAAASVMIFFEDGATIKRVPDLTLRPLRTEATMCRSVNLAPTHAPI